MFGKIVAACLAMFAIVVTGGRGVVDAYLASVIGALLLCHFRNGRIVPCLVAGSCAAIVMCCSPGFGPSKLEIVLVVPAAGLISSYHSMRGPRMVRRKAEVRPTESAESKVEKT